MEVCTASDSQKIASNTALNADSVLTRGDWAELPGGPFLPGSGCAIFDQSLFQSGELVVSHSRLGLRHLLGLVFSIQQGTERTERASSAVRGANRPKFTSSSF